MRKRFTLNYKMFEFIITDISEVDLIEILK
jgi:hypothetical protein